MSSSFALKRFNRALKGNPNRETQPTPQALTAQQHHDLYVKKYNESVASGTVLTQAEFMEYQLALAREKAGTVKPLRR